MLQCDDVSTASSSDPESNSVLSDDSFEEYLDTNFEKPEDVSVFEEIENYMKIKRQRVSVDPIEWWAKQNTFKALKALSSAFLAIATSQADVERSFSALAFILSPLRTKLSSENLEKIILVRLNRSVLGLF